MLKATHDVFDANHISSSIFQYKDLITPWVKMDETFGLWMHYYDESTIKSVATDKVEYADEEAKTAAIASKINPVLNEYFIENGKFKNFSIVSNESLFTELIRYFNTLPLGMHEMNTSERTYSVYATKEMVHFTGLPDKSTQMPLKIVSTEGKVLCDTTLTVREGKSQLPLSSFQKPAGKIVLVSCGTNDKAQKVFLP